MSTNATPIDHCFRCGRPTAPGVSLCEHDNPGGIKAPSATQVHGTILIGVIIGFALLALGARLVVGTAGPFSSSVEQAQVVDGGGVEVSLLVRNEGASAAAATCRLTRDGRARQEDFSFRTARIPAGESVSVTRSFPAPVGAPYDATRLSVACG